MAATAVAASGAGAKVIHELAVAQHPQLLRAPVLATLVERLVAEATPTPIVVASLSALSRMELSGDAMFSLLADIATTSEIVSLRMLAVRAIGNMYRPPPVAARVVAYALTNSTSFAVKLAAVEALSTLITASSKGLSEKVADSIADALASSASAAAAAASSPFNHWRVVGRAAAHQAALRRLFSKRMAELIALVAHVSSGAAARQLSLKLGQALPATAKQVLTAGSSEWSSLVPAVESWSHSIAGSLDAEATEPAWALIAAIAAYGFDPATGTTSLFIHPDAGGGGVHTPLVSRLTSMTAFWRAALATSALLCGQIGCLVDGSVPRETAGEGSGRKGPTLPVGADFIVTAGKDDVQTAINAAADAISDRSGLDSDAVAGILMSVGPGDDVEAPESVWWVDVFGGFAPTDLIDRLAEVCLAEGVAAAAAASDGEACAASGWQLAAATALVALVNRLQSVAFSRPHDSSADAEETSPRGAVPMALTPLRVAALCSFLRNGRARAEPSGPTSKWQSRALGSWSRTAAGATSLLCTLLTSDGSADIASGSAKSTETAASAAAAASAGDSTGSTEPAEGSTAAGVYAKLFAAESDPSIAAASSVDVIVESVVESLGCCSAPDFHAAALGDLSQAHPSVISASVIRSLAKMVAVGALTSNKALSSAFQVIFKAGDRAPADVIGFTKWLADGAVITPGTIPNWALATDGETAGGHGLSTLGVVVMTAAIARCGNFASIEAARASVREVESSAEEGSADAETADSDETVPMTVLALPGSGPASSTGMAKALRVALSASDKARRRSRAVATAIPSTAVCTMQDQLGRSVMRVRVEPLEFVPGVGCRVSSVALPQWAATLWQVEQTLADAAAAQEPEGVPRPSHWQMRHLRRVAKAGGGFGWRGPQPGEREWVEYFGLLKRRDDAIEALLGISGSSLANRVTAGRGLRILSVRALEDAAVAAADAEADSEVDSKLNGKIIRVLGRVAHVADAQISERKAAFARWAIARRA